MWEKLWHLRTVPKYISLTWKILQNGIAAKKNLFKKGVLIDHFCPICNLEKEYTDHVFADALGHKKYGYTPLGVRFDSTFPLFIF